MVKMYSSCRNVMDSNVLFSSNYLLTYLLTPWSRAPLEKLTGSAASQEIPRIFGTRRFLTVPTSANLLTTTIVAPPSNASKWQMGFNSAFKGLKAVQL